MKKILALMAVLISLGIVERNAFGDLPEPKKNENPNITAGRKAIEAKDYKGAVGHLSKAVQESPKDADAQSMLGFAYRKLGTFEKSMEHYQAALKLDPKHRSAREYLGELYLDMNQPANAEKELAALKKSCPMFGKCEEYDDLKEAIEKYNKSKK